MAGLVQVKAQGVVQPVRGALLLGRAMFQDRTRGTAAIPASGARPSHSEKHTLSEELHTGEDSERKIGGPPQMEDGGSQGRTPKEGASGRPEVWAESKVWR